LFEAGFTQAQLKNLSWRLLADKWKIDELAVSVWKYKVRVSSLWQWMFLHVWIPRRFYRKLKTITIVGQVHKGYFKSSVYYLTAILAVWIKGVSKNRWESLWWMIYREKGLVVLKTF
jgi:hypothetical protein